LKSESTSFRRLLSSSMLRCHGVPDPYVRGADLVNPPHTRSRREPFGSRRDKCCQLQDHQLRRAPGDFFFDSIFWSAVQPPSPLLPFRLIHLSCRISFPFPTPKRFFTSFFPSRTGLARFRCFSAVSFPHTPPTDMLTLQSLYPSFYPQVPPMQSGS